MVTHLLLLLECFIMCNNSYKDFNIDELNQLLVDACRKDSSTRRIKKLLKYGADINCEVWSFDCQCNTTPLKAACGNNKYYGIVKFLLENGADPNFTGEWNRSTPLDKACYYGGTDYRPTIPNKKVINILINHGGKLTSSNIDDLKWILEALKTKRVKSYNYLYDINYIQNIINTFSKTK